MSRRTCHQVECGPADRHPKGFTLIELAVVLAIISVVASITTPDLLRLRRSRNEEYALTSLRTTVSVQVLSFQTNDREGDGQYDPPESLGELDSEGLIDPAVGLGQANGYRFYLKKRTTDGTWYAGAHPVRYRRTGDRSFYVDEDDATYTDANRRATDKDPPLEGPGTPAPTPTPTPALPTPNDPLTAAGLRAIKRLNGLGDGQALQGAKTIVANPTNVAIILDELDTDDDGTIRWGEVLGVDYVALATKLVPLLGLSPDQTSVSETSTRAVCTVYVTSVANYVAIEPGEHPLPESDPSSAGGNPGALLDLAD